MVDVQRVTERVKAQLFARAMSLPPGVTRRLAGRPTRIDGLELSPQTQLMLRLQRLARERGPETYPAVERGRAALLRQAAMVGGTQPVGAVRERTVRGAEGPLRARLYVPQALLDRPSGRPARDPMLVFFHGGGMVYGDLDSHDAVCRFLCEQAGVRVLAVDYRLAPEHPFPAGVDDAWAAYEWVHSNARDYAADPDRLAVGGDSAGAYLAAATAIRAAERGVPLAYQLLVYPVTDFGGGTESRRLFGEDLYLTTEFMDAATEHYLRGHDLRDPRASVLYADLPAGLAPAYVATAGFDPLRDEGEAFARRLEEAGVPVVAKRFAGEIHGFANILSVDGTPRQAMAELAAALHDALVPTRV
jgi:acetyl esterase